MRVVLDDQSLFSTAPASAVATYRRRLDSPYGRRIGLLVVPDTRLAEIGRLAVAEPLPVCVVSSTGAGGLRAATRPVPGMEVHAVETALRDLDDLAGNAARVITAATQLDDDVTVYVEIPSGPGTRRAIETVEASGLQALVGTEGREPGELADHLSALVEADLAFKAVVADDLVWALLRTVRALVDGAEPREAARVLTGGALGSDPAAWDAATWHRVSRRVTRLGVRDPARVAAELSHRGLVAGG